MDQVDVAAERLRRADRELERRDLVAEGRPQRVERRGRVGVLLVALVDEEARRASGRSAERDGLLETGFDAGRRVHDEDRAVDRGEAGDHLGDEVGVARRVDDRDPRAVGLERRDRQAQRLLALLLLGLEIEVGRPVVDLAERGTAPDLNRSCSPSVVLPAPAWPARTTLRRWGRSTLFIVIGSTVLLRLRGGCRRGLGARGPAMIVGYTPARDVRSFQVVDDQAPEGRQ